MPIRGENLMYRSPYMTQAVLSYQQKDVIFALKRSRINQELEKTRIPDHQGQLSGLWSVIPPNDEVEYFTHPLSFTETDLAIDIRPFTQIQAGGYTISNYNEYRLLILYGVLTHFWMYDNPKQLLSLSDFPPKIFCRWLTDALVKTFGLDPNDQVKVTTVTLFYWYSLGKEDTEEFEEKDKMRIIQKLNAITSIPSSLSLSVVDDIQIMPTLEAYCEQLKRSINSPRLNKVSPALIYTIMGGSWYGTNVKELIAVSLEYPPAFLSIVKSAIDSKSYRRSILGSLVYSLDRQDIGKQFNKALHNLLNFYLNQ